MPGVSLANLVNIFNPECIVVTSPDTDTDILAGDLLLEPMYQAFKQHLFSQIGKDLPFIVERRSFESWARGAGRLVLSHFFASPERVHSERSLIGTWHWVLSPFSLPITSRAGCVSIGTQPE
jgi:predicted NBD/HSP70 family sugar kinase